jgi:hypothetical protein
MQGSDMDTRNGVEPDRSPAIDDLLAIAYLLCVMLLFNFSPYHLRVWITLQVS